MQNYGDRVLQKKEVKRSHDASHDMTNELTGNNPTRPDLFSK